MSKKPLELKLIEFDSQDYSYKFKIKEREKSFDYNSLKLGNGEYVFGPYQIWPAQLQSFAGSIAEEVKSEKITLNEKTFSKNNLVNLLETYRKSIFDRNYVSKKEIKSTFEISIKYLELGIFIGAIEKSIKEEFDKLPQIKKTYFKIFKKAGRKYIDNLCASKGHENQIELIHKNEEVAAGLHVFKYEVLQHRTKEKILNWLINQL